MAALPALGQNRVMVEISVPFDAFIRKPGAQAEPRELILLLHGYAETGERMFRKIEGALTRELLDQALVIAPNAPFPMPHKTESGYIATCSWYFYEPGASDYFIDMKPATEFLARGIRAHGAWDLPKRIIGFSQGGFLAPIAASALTHVRQFVGIGCEYLVDEIPGVLSHSVPYRVDAVHGALDEAVDPTRAAESHARLLAAGVIGSFENVAGSGHRIDDAIRAAVRAALGKTTQPG